MLLNEAPPFVFIIYFYSYLKKRESMIFCPFERKGNKVFVALESFGNCGRCGVRAFETAREEAFWFFLYLFLFFFYFVVLAVQPS